MTTFVFCVGSVFPIAIHIENVRIALPLMRDDSCVRCAQRMQAMIEHVRKSQHIARDVTLIQLQRAIKRGTLYACFFDYIKLYGNLSMSSHENSNAVEYGATMVITHRVRNGAQLLFVVMPRYTRLLRHWLFD